MLESGNDPARIVNERGLKQTSDTGTIEVVIADVMAANADKVAEYRSGKGKLFGFFVGQTWKPMQGKANTQVVTKLLTKGTGKLERQIGRTWGREKKRRNSRE